MSALGDEAVVGQKRKIEEQEQSGNDYCSPCISTEESQLTDKSEQKSSKRRNAMSWDDYFISVAFLSAMRSKDPSTQVGACIVNANKRIVGIGYNGFPRGCSDDALPWAREGDTELDTKYPVYILT